LEDCDAFVVVGCTGDPAGREVSPAPRSFHVRGRAAAGLVDVDRELVGVLPRDDAIGRSRSSAIVHPACPGLIGLRSRLLDPSQCDDLRRVEGSPEIEVLHGALRLRGVERIRGTRTSPMVSCSMRYSVSVVVVPPRSEFPGVVVTMPRMMSGTAVRFGEPVVGPHDRQAPAATASLIAPMMQQVGDRVAECSRPTRSASITGRRASRVSRSRAELRARWGDLARCAGKGARRATLRSPRSLRRTHRGRARRHFEHGDGVFEAADDRVGITWPALRDEQVAEALVE
jgi:hypothetical protein